MLPGKTYALSDVLNIVRRRKLFIAIPFLIVTIGFTAAAKLLPNRYRSETLILVVPQRVPETYVRSTVTSQIENRLQSIKQEILSRTLLQRIILEFNLYSAQRRTKAMEDVVERMRDDIDVELVNGDSFRVSYTSNDAITAMRVTQRLASLFIEGNLRDRQTVADGTTHFLETQLEDAKRRLIEREKQLENYRRSYSGQLPSQVESNIQAIRNLETELRTVTESLNGDRDRRLKLDRALTEAATYAAEPSVGSAGSMPLSGVAAALEDAKRQLHVLEGGLKPEHPEVLQARRLVRNYAMKLDVELAAHRATAPSTEPAPGSDAPPWRTRERQLRAELADLDSDIAVKKKEQARLENLVADYQRRVNAAPARESALIELTRDYETLQKTYATLVEKREESRLSANLERRNVGEQFKVVDPARLAERPIKPNRPLLVLLGLAGGLALGAAIAGGVEFRDTALHSEGDVVQVLRFSVLASIPVISANRSRRRPREQRHDRLVPVGRLITGDVTSSVALALASPGMLSDQFTVLPDRFTEFASPESSRLVVSAGMPDAAVEEYRKLATALHDAHRRQQTRVVMIASALPGEGKTLTAMNLSLTLSESYGRNVLLMDADFRRPSIQHIVGAGGDAGLVECLLDPEPQPLPLMQVSNRLSVLTAGGVASDPIRLLASNRMAEAIAAARAAFDWTIIDTPPMAMLPDARLLSGLVDAIVLVVRARRSPYLTVQDAVGALPDRSVLGVVLNGTSAEAMKYHNYDYWRYDDLHAQ